VKRLMCFCNLFSQADGADLASADIDACKNASHDTTHLQLTLPIIPGPPVPCQAVDQKPCTPSYNSTEYGSLPSNAQAATCQACPMSASLSSSSSSSSSSSTPVKPPATHEVSDFAQLQQCLMVNNSVCSFENDIQIDSNDFYSTLKVYGSIGNGPLPNPNAFFRGKGEAKFLHATLLGNGHTLLTVKNNHAPLARVWLATFVVHDLTFKGGNPSKYASVQGGAVSVASMYAEKDPARDSSQTRNAKRLLPSSNFFCYGCKFIENKGGMASAVYGELANLHLENCLFERNLGVYSVIYAQQSTLECKNCKFVDNEHEGYQPWTASSIQLNTRGWGNLMKSYFGESGMVAGYKKIFGNPRASGCHAFTCYNCHFQDPVNADTKLYWISDRDAGTCQTSIEEDVSCPAGSSPMGKLCEGAAGSLACTNVPNCDDFQI